VAAGEGNCGRVLSNDEAEPAGGELRFVVDVPGTDEGLTGSSEGLVSDFPVFF
jgi:hypothetical protein